jgi:thiol-disulfide isomerase/thioredoxin
LCYHIPEDLFYELALKRKYIKHLRSIGIQLAVFGMIFLAISYFQTRHMVSGKPDQFDLPNLGGETVLVPPNSDGRLKLVYFFAPWCGVCRLSMSNLNKIHTQHPEVRIQIVALDYESEDEVREFAADLGLLPPIFFGREDVRSAWGITAYPSYYFLNKDSTITAKTVGYSSEFGMLVKLYWSKWFG